jgi:sulfite reductase (ferredoxin)
MLFFSSIVYLLSNILSSSAFRGRLSCIKMSSSSEFVGKYKGEKKLQKVEGIKDRSDYLRNPLQVDLDDDNIFVSPDAVVVLKYHGSYMQDNRESRKKGEEKEYQFMLRLKSPAGEIPPNLYKELDQLSTNYGQDDLRATTRQAWQIHGILKGNLKTVISTIIKAGSSTIGACGDVSRNVMCTPAPLTSPAYTYARQYSKILGELFKPQSSALTELWLGEEKVAAIDYWLKDIGDIDVKAEMLKDTGRGVIVPDPVEPLYGSRYLPRKFKIGITVPGDNSIDIYTNDVGLVVITDASGNLEGFNVMVGGGMGRTHNKESTFARAADHLGFVSKDDILEFMKCILAAQRDHGNREVRPNARMKYLVHERGVEGFKTLVEGYFGKQISPWRSIPDWKYVDWMGWHEQGDGKYFLGINIEQGRVKDFSDAKIKTALRKVVDQFDATMILTPSQSVIFKDIPAGRREELEKLLTSYGIKPVQSIDSLTRLSIACPALPLCGLAVTEAERRMPEWVENTRKLLTKVGLQESEMIMRMTGCPNGCARPYMAELSLVGDGPDLYQIWLGGSPALTRVGFTYLNKVKWSEMDSTLEPLFVMWRDQRKVFFFFF